MSTKQEVIKEIRELRVEMESIQDTSLYSEEYFASLEARKNALLSKFYKENYENVEFIS